jgi:hypothetical protein
MYLSVDYRYRLVLKSKKRGRPKREKNARCHDFSQRFG